MGLSRSDWGLTDRISVGGPIRAAPERQRGFRQGNRGSEGAGGAKRRRMPRRGCHRQVTGGGQTGFLEEILNVSVTDSGHK